MPVASAAPAAAAAAPVEDAPAAEEKGALHEEAQPKRSVGVLLLKPDTLCDLGAAIRRKQRWLGRREFWRHQEFSDLEAKVGSH